ncbi:MAG TPA: SCO6880 family protein [Acidimicrobiales bacterium]|nr:SCO6880 family protein [Acidimicrobiales bacterium]
MTEATVRTYGNWRRPSSPGLGPLGTLGTITLLGGIVASLIGFMVMWQAGVAMLGLSLMVLVPLGVRDRHGKNGFGWIGLRLSWQHGKATGQHLYRSGPLSRTGHGRCSLPGLAASVEATEALDAWGRPFVLLRHRGVGHLSTVISTSPDGAALVDAAEVDNRVAHWGSWLAGLAHEPGLVAASVTIESAPDTGTRLAREVGQRLDAAAPALAQDVLRRIVASYPAGSAAISCRIALTWSTLGRGGTGRRNTGDMAVEIGHRLPALTRSLGSTGAGSARPMAMAELAAAVRIAYDPAAHPLIETTGLGGAGIAWPDAGPIAAEECWDHYRHDSAVSVVWVMCEAPSGHVFSSVLEPLVAPHGDIARKRVTLLYRPHDPASATRTVERDRLDAQFSMHAKRFGRARDAISKQAADRSAQEEAQGAGVVRFAMVVTATVAEDADLDVAAAAVENLGTTARLRLRRAYGSQSAAFVAGLPLGFVLPSHLRVPASVRELL